MCAYAAIFYTAGLGSREGLPSPRYDGATLVAELRAEGIEAQEVPLDARPVGAVWIVPCDHPELLDAAAESSVAAVLTSVFRPRNPWMMGLSEKELGPLRDPWRDDLEARQLRARSLRAHAYADSLFALVRAITWLFEVDQSGPGLMYLGALFNGVATPAIGEVFALDEPKMTLGRGRGVELSLFSPQVARSHLLIQMTGDVAMITDLNSTNGTCLQRPDGEWIQLAARQPSPLDPGDELIVADSFRLHLGEFDAT